MIIDFILIKTSKKNYSLNLSDLYSYSFDGDILNRHKNKLYIEGLYGNNISNINALVGENGAGKTTIIKNLLEILNNKPHINTDFLVVCRDGKNVFIVSNMKKRIYSTFKVERKTSDFISRNLQTFFHSNVFDANNIFKSTINIKNISTNAQIEENFPYNFSLDTYRKEQNNKQILFTILHRNTLEIDKYVRVPNALYLSLNNQVILTIDQIYKEFMTIGHEIKIEDDDFFSLESQYFKIISHNYYLKLIKWINDFMFILKTGGDNIVGKVILKDEEFDNFWLDLSRAAKINSDEESEYLKRNFKTVILENIDDFIGDKNILFSTIKLSLEKKRKKFNIEEYTWLMIISELKSFIINQLDIEMNIIEEDIEEIKKSLIYVDINISKMQQSFRSWLTKRLKKGTNENLITEIKIEFITLMRKYISSHNMDDSFLVEDSLIGDLATEEDIYVSFLEDSSDFYKENIKYNEPYETDFVEELIRVFENNVNSINQHLNQIIMMFNEARGISENFSTSLMLNSKSSVVKDYFKNYKNENIFELSWRNLSSGELSFLVFLSRFYEVSQELKCNKDVLIVIDEGDLYFHPQWQKKYIDILVKALNHIFTSNKIQVVLTSHSPFIISDLPHYSVQLISKTKDVESSEDALGKKRTFAANIQDLYSNSFFIQGGLTGEFSKRIINEAINEIQISEVNAFNNQTRYMKIFELIGEPLVRNKCLELLNSRVRNYASHTDKQNEIELLKERIKLLENQL